MLKDISIGRYHQGDSYLHRMDPRLKIILFIVYMIVIFSVNEFISIVSLILVTMMMIILGRLPLKVIANTILPVLPIAIFIFILNMFTNKEGKILVQWWRFAVYDKGLQVAAIMSFRLVILIVFTSIILTLTTTPLKFSEGLELLLSPLKKIKIPVSEMAMMMSIALRFIPTLIDETDKIMKAQVSRGADYDTGSILNRLKGYITILIPLFISSFRRADELATAMDARCYNGGDGRTRLNPLRITKTDVIIFAILLLVAAMLFVIQKVVHIH